MPLKLSLPITALMATLVFLAGPSPQAASTETLVRAGQPIKENPGGGWYEAEPTTKSLRLKLSNGTAEPLSGFYSEIPPNLEPAARKILLEDYAAAEEILARDLDGADSDRKKARILMWLGLSAGQEALDQPKEGHDSGTSASRYLVQAIRLDPKVLEAPDVVRTLADMAGSEWGMRDSPEAPNVLEAAVEKAESSGKALDYFYAGVMARRIGIIAWTFGKEEQFNRLAYRMLSRAVELEPTRYEFWTMYLPSMQPIMLHEHMTSESVAMHRYFRPLRHPLLMDQGPTQLHIRTREGFSVEDEDRMLEELAQERPDDPYPRYQLARWAIETTPSLALERFEKFVADLDAGKIRLQPKEEGYRASAIYEVGFLCEDQRGTTVALEHYLKVKAISPTYAHVNGNIASAYARLADQETTGPEKIRLMELALEHANQQAKIDYQGKAKERATFMRRQLLRSLQKVRREVAAQEKKAVGGAQ